MKKTLEFGAKYGRWTVKERSAKMHYYSCICDCGAVRDVYAYSLVKGASVSCGCHLAEWTAAKNFKHGSAFAGAKRSRTYNIWANMKARCQNPNNPKFPSYGARGIFVCESWQAFPAFLEDMGEAPAEHSIDRIDNNLGYFPGNCRWATNTQQANNVRSNRLIEIDGETKTLSEWSAVSGVKAFTISRRLRVGVEPKLAVFNPPCR